VGDEAASDRRARARRHDADEEESTMANIEGLTVEQEAHAKGCPRCRPGYERAMKNPRDSKALAACRTHIEACMRDQRDQPRR